MTQSSMTRAVSRRMSLRRRMAARVSFRFFLPSRRTGSRRAFCPCTGRIRWPLRLWAFCGRRWAFRFWPLAGRRFRWLPPEVRRWPFCPLRGRCAPLWLLRPPVGKVMLLSG